MMGLTAQQLLPQFTFHFCSQLAYSAGVLKRELSIFKAQHETALPKEVVLEQPDQHALGSKERGSSWDKILKNLVNGRMKVTKQSITKRFTKLYEERKEGEEIQWS